MSGLLALAAEPPPPRRVVSLDLCADELALALAAPGQLASVSWLGASAHETALAPRARGLHRNDGRFETVAKLRPDLVLISGGGGRYAAEMAAQTGARVVILPPPQRIADVRANIAALGSALGRAAAAAALTARLDRDLGPTAARLVPALMVSGGGWTPRPDGLAAAYLAHAGLRHTGGGGQVALERLLIHPPAILVLSRYRAGQTSLGQRWLEHPALVRLPSRRIALDGRGWTCLGPEAAHTLPALRAAVQLRPATSTAALRAAVPLSARRT